MRTLATTLLLGSALAAQVTSPRGFDTIEGNTSFSHWGGSRRFQQIDYSQNGAPMVISSIAWRRNGGSTGTSIRTFDFQVDLGRGDFSTISHKLDANFIAGTRTTVFNQTAVNFPDWSTVQPTPAPFDFKVVLGTPYVYTGTDSLVIDFSYTNNSSTGSLTVDREFNGPTTPTTGTALGTGCIATGNTSAFTHSAYMANLSALPVPEYGLRLRLGGSNAPASGGVIALIDVVNQNLPGVLCTTLYSGGLVTLPLTQSGTVIDDLNLNFAYDANVLGATLFTQLLAIDAGQTPFPVVLSNGRQTTMPLTPTAGTQHRCSYGWYSTPSTTGTATHFTGGGMVMQIQ